MIANNGLSGVEQIYFGTSGPKPIYFSGTVNFADVVSLNADAKIYGRENDNTFHGGNLGEYVEGDGGNDTLNGNGGNDTLYGDTTDSNPWAASNIAGNDTLRGGLGNDALHGQGGNDILNGGSGDKNLWGDAGLDQFQFTTAGDHSIVRDFVIGQDRLQFDNSIADEFSDLTIANDGSGNAHITVGDIDITVTGVSAASLTASNFDFGLFV